MKREEYIYIIICLIIGWYMTSGEKTQSVRLFDVFIIGPSLIYIGMDTNNKLFKYMLYLFGATTITYNLKNYLIINGNI